MNMENNYTKGPWRLSENSDSQDAIMDHEGTKAICFIPILGSESEANIKLIIAAPELLEALIELVDIAQTTDAGEINPRDYEAYKNARNAIKKATT